MNKANRQQHWQNILQQWRDSGLSKKRFCAENNITLSNFYRWQKILSANESTASSFIALKPEPVASELISLAVGSLRLQLPASYLGVVLIQLKSSGLIDA